MVAYSFDLIPTPAALPNLLVAASILVLGIFVLARERASTVAISLFALTSLISLWLTSVSMMMMVTTARTAFVFARLAYVGVALIPAAVLQFTVALLDDTKKRRTMLLASWLGSTAFLIVFITTRALLAGTWEYSWGFYPRLSRAAVTFLLFFGTLLIGSLRLLAVAQPQTEQERLRIRSFLVALGIGYVGSIDYLPAFGMDLFPLGCLGIFGFMALTARTIFHFRLTDLSPSFIADRLLQTMHGGVLVIDTQGRVRVANDVAAQLLGQPLANMRNADLRALLGVDVLPMTDTDSFVRRSMTRNRIVTWPRGDGSLVELSLSASAVRDTRGDVIGILYAMADVSDRRRAEENEYGATHDLLTRLPNRVRFAQMFDRQKEIIAATGRVACVLFIDLDGFKAVNDRHGHAVGDALLRLVATRVRNAIRGDDVLARYGGDEFVVLLDLARTEDAAIVGQKLLRVVSEDYSIDEQIVSVTASIGAAFHPRDGATVDALVQNADSAMYRAKRAGKARMISVRDDRPAPPPFGIDARA